MLGWLPGYAAANKGNLRQEDGPADRRAQNHKDSDRPEVIKVEYQANDDSEQSGDTGTHQQRQR